MRVATGRAEIMAFELRIQHGNHNNAMLIDRHVETASYRLALVLSEAVIAISKMGSNA